MKVALRLMHGAGEYLEKVLDFGKQPMPGALDEAVTRSEQGLGKMFSISAPKPANSVIFERDCVTVGHDDGHRVQWMVIWYEDGHKARTEKFFEELSKWAADSIDSDEAFKQMDAITKEYNNGRVIHHRNEEGLWNVFTPPPPLMPGASGDGPDPGVYELIAENIGRCINAINGEPNPVLRVKHRRQASAMLRNFINDLNQPKEST